MWVISSRPPPAPKRIRPAVGSTRRATRRPTDCLAAAGLADKAKRLTAADRQIDAVYGADRPNLTPQKAPENGIVERDAFNLQLGSFAPGGRGPGSVCRRFRPGQRDRFDSWRGINRRGVTGERRRVCNGGRAARLSNIGIEPAGGAMVGTQPRSRAAFRRTWA